MLSIRLPIELEIQVKRESQIRHVSKTEIIKEALRFYFAKEKTTASPYELGKDLFGRFSLDDENLSATYKTKLKEKLSAKHNH